jgi:hypothetical protein
MGCQVGVQVVEMDESDAIRLAGGRPRDQRGAQGQQQGDPY